MRRAGIVVGAAIIALLLFSPGAANASGVVLGGVVYGDPSGVGWGTARPGKISNGNDLGSVIGEIHWSSWGGAVARGSGSQFIFKAKGGGYYPHPVVARLKATSIGRCEGRRAYLKLLVREPKKPGGPLGAWHSLSGPNTICEVPSLP